MAKKNTQPEFNPVKEFLAGLKVTAVKWSSKVLNKAKDAIKKGLPLKANPFLNNDIQLLKPDLVFERTDEEIEIYKRCMNDVVYFASFCYLMTPAGLKKCELRDYLVDYLKHLQINNFSLFLSCRQSGKTLTLFNNLTISLNINSLSKKIITKTNKNECFSNAQLKIINDLLRKYYFYIEDNCYIISLPAFEVFHIYETGIINNIRYNLYKLIYKLLNGK